MATRELTDAEVFGTGQTGQPVKELSDAEVFGSSGQSGSGAPTFFHTPQTAAQQESGQERPGLASTTAASLTQAVLGISRSIFETPETVERMTNRPARMVENTPLMAHPALRGIPLLNYLSRVIRPASKPVAESIGEAQNALPQLFKPFQEVSLLSQEADKALGTAVNQGEFGPLLDVLKDPKQWSTAIANAAPSLYAAIKSGGSIPFIAWMEGMETATDAKDFERRTGNKISDEKFSQAVVLTGAVNAVLEKVGLDKIRAAWKVANGPQKRVLGKVLNGAVETIVAGQWEGLTELAQQINTNFQQKIAYDKDKNLLEGALQSYMGGTGSGTGAAAAGRVVAPAAPEGPGTTGTPHGELTDQDVGIVPHETKSQPIESQPVLRRNFAQDGSYVDTAFELVDAKDVSAPPQTAQVQLNPQDMGDSQSLESGAPVVGPENVLEARQDAASSISTAYQNNQGQPYKQWLIDNAEQFGLTRRQVESMDQPMLVRRRISEAPQTPQAVQAVKQKPQVEVPEQQEIKQQEIRQEQPKASKRVQEIQQAIEPTISRWKNAPKINVVQSVSELPDKAAPHDVEGAYAHDGQIYLVADNLPTTARAKQVLAHEAIGHAAFEQIMAEDLPSVLSEISRLEKTDESVRKAAEIVDENQPGLDDVSRAKEIIAVMAENGVQNNIIKRVVAAIRKYLKSIGIDLELSGTDIAGMLRSAEKHLEKGKTRKKSRTAQYSRKGYTESYEDIYAEALRPKARPQPQADQNVGRTVAGRKPRERWHRETRVRGPDGKPIATARGSYIRLTEKHFELSALGYNTKHPTSGLGVWVTMDLKEAPRYGPNIETFYLDVRNPAVFKIGTRDLPVYDLVKQYFQYRERLIQRGFDAIMLDMRDIGGTVHFALFNPEQMIYAKPQYSRKKQAQKDITQTGTWYSSLERGLSQAKQTKAPAKDWKAIVSKLPGVKADEIDAVGLNEWLDLQTGQVTREQVLDFVRQNGVQVQESVRQVGFQDGVVKAPKFSDYQLPGGENYRELLLTLPGATEHPGLKRFRSLGRISTADMTPDQAEEYNRLGREIYPNGIPRPQEDVATREHTGFRSSHFDEPNILAHVRFNERTDADGKRVLFIEEVQSDWAQKGRKEGFVSDELNILNEAKKEYETLSIANAHVRLSDAERARLEELRPIVSGRGSYTDGVPSAPFVTKTESWTMLAMKRMIRYAAENGFDRVAWTTGEQQADRYDLSKQIDSLLYAKRDDGTYQLKATKRRGGEPEIIGASVPENKLADHVGKEVAEKIVSGAGEEVRHTRFRQLTGLDLKVGGEGMRAFYDQMLPQWVNKYVKKWGGKVGETKVDTGERGDGPWAVIDATDDGEQQVFDRFGTEREAMAALEDFDGGVDVKYMPIGEVAVNSFDITPAMRESVMQGQPLFSRRKEIVIGNSGRKYTKAQMEAMKATGSVMTESRLSEIIKDAWTNIGMKMAQGIADQFAPVKDISRQAYTLMRLSKGATGAFEAFMNYGKLSVDNEGVYDADTSGGVLPKVFIPLGKETTDFLRWVAGNRAERLMKEGREHLFTKNDIDAFKSLSEGQTDFDYQLQDGTTTRSRIAVYRDSLAKFNEFNKNILDVSEKSGLIDPESRHLWENEFYVPFYRVEQNDGGIRGMNIKSGVVRQEAFKRLKGGKQQLNDLLMSTLMNWSHLIDAAAKNRAAQATLQAAEKVGAARRASSSEKGTVWYMGNTEITFPDGTSKSVFMKNYYKVNDPLLLTAISSLEYAGMRNPAMKALQSFKHWLTIGVTASPFFKVRNLIRDSMQAVATADLSYNVLGNVITGAIATRKGTPTYTSALAAGGLIRFGTMLEGNETKRTRDLIAKGASEAQVLDNQSKIETFLDKWIYPTVSAYNELGNRGEEINRMALYRQMRAKGMSHGEAALAARDLLDFSMSGAWNSIRFLTQVVPFMNARMQGLYKLGRAANENPERFSAVVGATALVSIALLLAYKDDDDWKRREDWDRDNYWWFKIGGLSFRIPKPFEIGAIASLAERSVELWVSDEMTKKRFLSRIAHILGDQLSLNPTPQLVKPVIDLYANKDSFTGRPIETMGMERLKSEYRFTANTSMVARMASTGTGGVLSPVQIDHLVRAYFGWLGTFTTQAADLIARPFSGDPKRPSRDFIKTVTGGMVQQLEGAPSRYVSQIYEQSKVLEEAYGTYMNLMKQKRREEAKSFMEKYEQDIKTAPYVEAMKRAMSGYNTMIRQIEIDDHLSPDEKRRKINQIRERKHNMAKRFDQKLRENERRAQ